MRIQLIIPSIIIFTILICEILAITPTQRRLVAAGIILLILLQYYLQIKR